MSTGRPNYNRKVDANQKSVFERLRQLPGVSIQDLSGMGDGCPDFILGFQGVNYLVELKDSEQPKSKQQLTEAEEKFFTEWTGSVSKCNSFEEIFQLITNQHPFNELSKNR